MGFLISLRSNLFMYTLVKKILFKKDPEKVHHWVMDNLHRYSNNPFLSNYLRRNFVPKNERLQTRIFGLNFKNPVGLAAGFDKDAKYIDDLAKLGFGFVEIGTLTPKPQSGNDKPRLFRIPEDNALINRMGFNNEGVDAAVERLKKRKSDIIVGGNIGKNKITPNENAMDDYDYCFRKLYDYVDYFVVNVSSPNTPNLRALQEKEPLQNLLSHLQKLNIELGNPKPLLLKIAPDITWELLDEIIEILLDLKLDGIVATNTTISRENLISSSTTKDEKGGLSGKPLTEKSTEVIKYIHQKTNGKLPIMGVGGIFTAQDAKEKLDAGASLVQVYTGFIYEGPAIVKKICEGI